MIRDMALRGELPRFITPICIRRPSAGAATPSLTRERRCQRGRVKSAARRHDADSLMPLGRRYPCIGRALDAGAGMMGFLAYTARRRKFLIPDIACYEIRRASPARGRKAFHGGRKRRQFQAG